MNHQKKRLQLSLKGQDFLFLQRRLHRFGLLPNRSQDQKFVVSKKKTSSLFRFSSDASPRGLKGEVRVTTEIAARFFSNLKDSSLSIGEKVYFEVSGKLYEVTISNLKISNTIIFFKFHEVTNRVQSEFLASSSYIFLDKTSSILQSFLNEQSLLGFKVRSLRGIDLGFVKFIEGSAFQSFLKTDLTIIPNVPNYVKKIDNVKKIILVDWESGW
jgi:ribosomal 30S subunit maturation factor RimM